jgi:hypothetical protein
MISFFRPVAPTAADVGVRPGMRRHGVDRRHVGEDLAELLEVRIGKNASLPTDHREDRGYLRSFAARAMIVEVLIMTVHVDVATPIPLMVPPLTGSPSPTG